MTLARLSPTHPRYDALNQRQNELIAAPVAKWTNLLQGIVTGVEFHRGFPSSVALPAEKFLKQADRIWSLGTIRRIRLSHAAQLIERLSEFEGLSPVVDLDLSNNELTDEQIYVLGNSPHLPRLESLDLSFCGLENSAFRAMIRSPFATKLKTVRVTDNQIRGGAQVGDYLYGFERLERLDVTANSIDDYGLRDLCVFNNPFRMPGYIAKELSLQVLHFANNSVEEWGLVGWMNSPLFKSTIRFDRALDLSATRMTLPALDDLCQSPLLNDVESLTLNDNNLGDDGVALLACSKNLMNLRELKLRNNGISSLGVRFLLDAPWVDRLQRCDLSSNFLSDDALRVMQDAMKHGDPSADDPSPIEAMLDAR